MMTTHFADNFRLMNMCVTRPAGRAEVKGAPARLPQRKLRSGVGAAACAAALALWPGPVTAAEQAPAGMVSYDHPVFHNGHRVLWHGSWRAKKAGASEKSTKDSQDAATGAPASNETANPQDANSKSQNDTGKQTGAATKPAPPAIVNHEFVLLADSEDPNATQMAVELVNALKSSGLKAHAWAWRASPAALAKAVTSDAGDMAIVAMDAFAADPNGAETEARAPILARLADEPLAVVAAKSVASVGDLNGRPVSFGMADGSAGASAQTFFAKLGVQPKVVREPLTASLADLAAGKLDAIVVAGGGSKALSNLGKGGKFHIVSIPWATNWRFGYAPARLTAKDFPNLIGADEKVETLATPMALVAVDAAPEGARATRYAPVVSALYEKFDALLAPNGDPKWREVNLAANANWPRARAVQDWIAHNSGQSNPALENFRSIAHTVAQAGAGPEARDADTLYQSFMQWRGDGQ